MQELKINEDLFYALFDGTKRACIRMGCNITTGSLALEAASGGYGVIVNVTEVKEKTVSEITEEEARLEGADSVEELKNILKTAYPNISDSSIVSVILFDFKDVLDIPEEILFGDSDISEN